MSEIEDVIARLEKATGPDDVLDADILKIANPQQWEYCDRLRHEMIARAKANGLNDRGEACWRGAFGGICRYTSSIDAALTLVPDEYRWLVRSHDGSANFDGTGRGAAAFANVYDNNEALMHDCFVRSTPAIALCIAALKARVALSGSKSEAP